MPSPGSACAVRKLDLLCTLLAVRPNMRDNEGGGGVIRRSGEGGGGLTLLLGDVAAVANSLSILKFTVDDRLMMYIQLANIRVLGSVE